MVAAVLHVVAAPPIEQPTERVILKAHVQRAVNLTRSRIGGRDRFDRRARHEWNAPGDIIKSCGNSGCVVSSGKGHSPLHVQPGEPVIRRSRRALDPTSAVRRPSRYGVRTRANPARKRWAMTTP